MAYLVQNSVRFAFIPQLKHVGFPAHVFKTENRLCGPLVGRNISEGDTFYTYITFDQYEQILKKGRKFLNAEEDELLKRIMHISRSAKQ